MNFGTYILVKLITLYKYLVSPLIGHSCRYLPTCSDYFIDCLNEYGILRGTAKGFKRILSCHPLGGHGYDPVKKGKN